MTVVSVDLDPDALTLTIVAEFAEPAERVWQIWSDPRMLEQWWGPPGFPATMVRHDLTPGGRVTYFMTGPRSPTAIPPVPSRSGSPPSRALGRR